MINQELEEQMGAIGAKVEPIAPPGVTIKEGLSEDFIKKVKRALRSELPEPTPEELKELAKLLKKVFGVTMAAYMTKQNSEREFNGLIRGRVPEEYEKFSIIRAADIAKILVSKLTYEEARDWMLAPSPYLEEVPAFVIRDDPELVRKAALWRVRGA